MKQKRIFKILSIFIAAVFLTTTLVPAGYAQLLPTATVLNLPVPGTMVGPSEAFAPVLIKGVTVYPENPLRFDFIVDTGDEQSQTHLRGVSNRLIKYFLASLTVPEEDLWVNLSPYEADRIIPEKFGQTEMGRDLLAQDYMLKQLTASLMYPEDELGETFWDAVYEKAYEEYGVTDIPVDTFNKVWIVPEKAVVYENDKTNTAFVVESRLKVMLEEDYVAIENNVGTNPRISPIQGRKQGFAPTTSIIRDLIIPAIEHEVNEGTHFAQLRQIYHSLILATWYKRNLKESILGKIYVGQNKIDGVDIADKQAKQKIYNQYLESFKQGAYDYIKEEYNSSTQEILPRKYFSGGGDFLVMDKAMAVTKDRLIGQEVEKTTDKASNVSIVLDPLSSKLKDVAMTVKQLKNIPQWRLETTSLFLTRVTELIRKLNNQKLNADELNHTVDTLLLLKERNLLDQSIRLGAETVSVLFENLFGNRNLGYYSEHAETAQALLKLKKADLLEPSVLVDPIFQERLRLHGKMIIEKELRLLRSGSDDFNSRHLEEGGELLIFLREFLKEEGILFDEYLGEILFSEPQNKRVDEKINILEPLLLADFFTDAEFQQYKIQDLIDKFMKIRKNWWLEAHPELWEKIHHKGWAKKGKIDENSHDASVDQLSELVRLVRDLDINTTEEGTRKFILDVVSHITDQEIFKRKFLEDLFHYFHEYNTSYDPIELRVAAEVFKILLNNKWLTKSDIKNIVNNKKILRLIDVIQDMNAQHITTESEENLTKRNFSPILYDVRAEAASGIMALMLDHNLGDENLFLEAAKSLYEYNEILSRATERIKSKDDLIENSWNEVVNFVNMFLSNRNISEQLHEKSKNNDSLKNQLQILVKIVRAELKQNPLPPFQPIINSITERLGKLPVVRFHVEFSELVRALHKKGWILEGQIPLFMAEKLKEEFSYSISRGCSTCGPSYIQVVRDEDIEALSILISANQVNPYLRIRYDSYAPVQENVDNFIKSLFGYLNIDGFSRLWPEINKALTTIRGNDLWQLRVENEDGKSEIKVSPDIQVHIDKKVKSDIKSSNFLNLQYDINMNFLTLDHGSLKSNLIKQWLDRLVFDKDNYRADLIQNAISGIAWLVDADSQILLSMNQIYDVKNLFLAGQALPEELVSLDGAVTQFFRVLASENLQSSSVPIAWNHLTSSGDYPANISQSGSLAIFGFSKNSQKSFLWEHPQIKGYQISILSHGPMHIQNKKNNSESQGPEVMEIAIARPGSKTRIMSNVVSVKPTLENEEFSITYPPMFSGDKPSTYKLTFPAGSLVVSYLSTFNDGIVHTEFQIIRPTEDKKKEHRHLEDDQLSTFQGEDANELFKKALNLSTNKSFLTLDEYNIRNEDIQDENSKIINILEYRYKNVLVVNFLEVKWKSSTDILPGNHFQGRLTGNGEFYFYKSEGLFKIDKKGNISDQSMIVDDTIAAASVGDSILKKGGIDLNANTLPLQTQGSNIDFNFQTTAAGFCMNEDNNGECERLDIKALENMVITGFTPVIFNIVPITNLPFLLGLDEGNVPFDAAQDDNTKNLSFYDHRYWRPYSLRPQVMFEVC